MYKFFFIAYSNSVSRNKSVLFEDKNRYYNSFFLKKKLNIYNSNIIGF